MAARKRKSTSRARQGPAHSRTFDASVSSGFLLDVSHLHKTPPAPLWIRFMLPLYVAGCAFACFLPALDAEFVNWDDDKVVTENPHFRGFTEENIKWMFTQTKMGHYHPLTWMSYAVDHAIGASRYDGLSDEAKARYTKGLDPKIFHLTNLLLHAVVAVAFYYLACLLFRLMLPPPTDRPDVATPVAAALATLLFACHPLRVETVVWVTERRDVLSSAFLVPCLLCYMVYVLKERWGPGKIALYVGAIVLLFLSLLSKAWGITLPAVMLVLDVYPLKRIGGRAGWLSSRAITAYLDKIPFAILAVCFAVKAKSAQAVQLDTMKSLAEWGVGDRIAQAFYGLFFYSYKTLVPIDLTPLVPLPVHNDPWAFRYVGAAAVVLAVAVTLVFLRKRWPAGIVLAVCYAGVLSPILGIAQSGPQLVADKYSYLACLTWALLGGACLLWVLRKKAEVSPAKKAVAVAAAVSVCGMLGYLTWQQSELWHDSRSLWTHAVRIDPKCVLARTNLGLIERQAGNVDKAIEHYQAALKEDPDDYTLLNNLAVAVREDPQRLDESIAITRKAVALRPGHPDLRYSLASALKDAGRYDEAVVELNKCIRLKSGQPKYHRGLAQIYHKTKRYDAAEKQYKQTLKLELKLNDYGMGVINALDRLGRIMMAQGRTAEATSYFERILEINPKNAPANRALMRLRQNAPR